jgi:transposase
MIKLLLTIKEFVDKQALTKKRLNGKTIKHFRKRYEQILQQGYTKTRIEFNMNPPPKSAQAKPKNLLDRLKVHATEVLAFMYDLSIPFDNNQAERDIRMIKLQQKISGTFRSETGPAYFARIRSYISTAQKQNMNILDALENAFLGKPFIPSLNQAE